MVVHEELSLREGWMDMWQTRVTLDNAEIACSFYIPGCDVLNGKIVGQRTEIDGMFALSSGCHIAWADTERHVVFHLYSEDITSEQLLEIARSIQRADS